MFLDSGNIISKILDKEDQVSRRRIKEAIRIHQGRPGLNRDTGLDIPPVILQLVAHNPEGSCDTNGHKLPSPDEGREILPKIWEPSHHNLTLRAECFIRSDRMYCKTIHRFWYYCLWNSRFGSDSKSHQNHENGISPLIRLMICWANTGS